MNNESTDETTQALADRTAVTRSRVASDIERLTEQLTPARVKDRALDAAERSVETLAARALGRLLQSPRRLANYLRQHPATGAAIAAGMGVVIWRLASRRR
jgi:ElaB/YqjD/DUF883 family membrane-anchored ribosome-binding protein